MDEFGYTNFLAAMYINTGTLASPSFSAHNVSPSLDFTAKFKTAGIYANWAANHLVLVDIDKDGDTDILVASQDKIFLVRNPGAARPGNINNWAVTELNYNQRDGFTGTLGGSCISAADFDKDGDIDIIVGTVNHEFKYLAYYENDAWGFHPDGHRHPRRVRRDVLFPGRHLDEGLRQRRLARHLRRGGQRLRRKPSGPHVDAAEQGSGGCDRDGPRQSETVKQVSWDFQCLNGCAPIIPGSNDVDMLTPMDYDKDGDYDVIVADANDSGDYYLIINHVGRYLHPERPGQSTNIGLDGLIRSTNSSTPSPASASRG